MWGAKSGTLTRLSPKIQQTMPPSRAGADANETFALDGDVCGMCKIEQG
jgi:hypothetical protein